MKRVNPDLYTKEYYLTDATGYREYMTSYGKVLGIRFKRIVGEIPSVKGLKVLDIGCGRGELAYWAARNGAKSVLGIDYSKAAIKLANSAKKHWQDEFQQKVTFKVLDAKKIKFRKESYDAVFLTEVLEHLYQNEQELIFNKIDKLLKNTGFVFFHTAPTKWFNDYTYRFWCYPISTVLVKVNNLLFRKNYSNITHPIKLRPKYHKIMHVNEPDYFSLRNLFDKYGLSGAILSTNITINKPNLSWKDDLFNLIVYLSPISNYPPFNIFWGNDFYSVLRKKKNYG